MLVRNLVPLAILGGISVHSGGAIRERMAAALGLGKKVVARQHITIIIDTVNTLTAAGNKPDFETQQEFRDWVKSTVKIKGESKADPSVDPWGTPLRGTLISGALTITSAGEDKKFDTKDDIVVYGSVIDY